MGNTNQGQSGGNLQGGERSKQRRPSVAEGPLVVPMGTQRYMDTTPPSSQTKFGKTLLEQAGLNKEQEFLKQSLHQDPTLGTSEQYTRRYRAGSISMEVQPPGTVPPPSPPPTKKNKIPAVIKWDKEGREVFISGTFNNWERKIPLVKSEKNFYTIVDLAEGEHQYKFYVDGQWKHNPDEPVARNDQGTMNNVLKVAAQDFEILAALESDNRATNTSRKIDAVTGKTSTCDLSDAPQEEYGKEIPVRKPTDRHTGPPLLPPHLLQVILNKDVSDHLEPGMLPEPNHVMLNHLYALSIKDGVMVLSDTSRYKKKYVTTLLYKPIDS